MHHRETPDDMESMRLFNKLKVDAGNLGITVEISDRCFRLMHTDGTWIASHNNLDYLDGVLRGIRWSREQSKDFIQGADREVVG